MKKLLIILFILFPLITYSKITQFDVIGEIGIEWGEYENPIDKTDTAIETNGQADYDDHNGFIKSDIKVGIRAYISRMVTALIEFQKRDILWATHDNQMSPDKYQTLGSLFGVDDPKGKDVWWGIKLTKANVKIEEVMEFMNFTLGRQYITGSIYPEDLEKDLIMNTSLDAIRMDLRFDPFEIMGFFAKVNDDASQQYAIPLQWDVLNKNVPHKYENKDFNLYGIYFYLNRIYENLEPRIYFLNGILNDPNVSNPDGKIISNYDNRKIIGTKLNFYLLDSLLKIKTEFAYQFGEKYIGQYQYLDEETLTVKTEDFWDKAKYQAYVFDFNTSYKNYLSKGIFIRFLGEFVGGSGDDSTTPEIDTGFKGYNDMFYGIKTSHYMRGWGAIVKANPYTQPIFAPDRANFINGEYLEDDFDKRTVDQTYSIFPCQIIHFGLEFGIDEYSAFKGLTLGGYYFKFRNLSKDGAVYLDEDNIRYKTSDIGDEIDIKLSYEFENRNITFSLIYGMFFPGETYKWGKDTNGKSIGDDTVTMFLFQATLFFY